MKAPAEAITEILRETRPFARAVYRVVLTIPRGETRSYKWVARRIGRRPGAARAVGQALKRNPCPGIIPCHRVVKSDGTPGGYNQGIRLKQRLLKMEETDD